MLDLNSIATREELTKRVQWLKALNAFLDNRCSSQFESTTYKANLFLLTIPTNLGVEGDSDRVYVIMTATCLIGGWSRAKNGKFVLTGLSMATT